MFELLWGYLWVGMWQLHSHVLAIVFFSDSLAGSSLFWQESPKDVVVLGLLVGMGKVIARSGADQGLFSGLLRVLSAFMQVVFGTGGDGRAGR